MGEMYDRELVEIVLAQRRARQRKRVALTLLFATLLFLVGIILGAMINEAAVSTKLKPSVTEETAAMLPRSVYRDELIAAAMTHIWDGVYRIELNDEEEGLFIDEGLYCTIEGRWFMFYAGAGSAGSKAFMSDFDEGGFSLEAEDQMAPFVLQSDGSLFMDGFDTEMCCQMRLIKEQ